MTQNQKLVAGLVENLRDYAIFTLDPAGVITSWNKGVHEVLGYEEHEFTGHLGDIIFTPEDREAGVPEREMTIAREQGRAPDNRWHLRKDGSRVFVNGVLIAHYDPAGTLLGFAKIICDETKRQQAEAAVVQSEARYRALVEVGDAAVWRTGAQGELIWTNEAFERLSGLNLERAQGQGWLEVVHPDDRSRTAKVWQRALATTTPYDVEHRVRGRDGRYRWVHSRAVPVLAEDGSVREWVGVDTDISQRKEAEQERERLLAELNVLNETLEERVKERTQQVQALAGELTLAEAREQARLAQVLHDDLQQQLFTVQFALHDLRRRMADNTEVQAALEGVGNLLKAAVVSARGTTANLSPPVLQGEGLVEAVRWLGSDLKERYGLVVKVEAASAPVIPNESIRVLLFNLVRELLFNVVKHAGVNEATVALREHNGVLEIEVADQGVGFDPAVLDTHGQGTGWGLSGVRKRLDLFGGRLDIATAPSQGTRITIHLPQTSTTLD